MDNSQTITRETKVIKLNLHPQVKYGKIIHRFLNVDTNTRSLAFKGLKLTLYEKTK